MIAAEMESPAWSRRRWLAVITLMLVLHVGLIFWMGNRKAIASRLPVKGPAMYLPRDQTADLPGLSDPTLFVLPNRHGFSGPAWLKIPSMEYQLKEWTEPEPPPVALPELDRTLNELVQGNLSRPFEVARKPEPQLDELEYTPPTNPMATQSTFTIEGDLARRPLLSPFKLESWPAAQILTNSVVLVSVNSEGTVFSAVLLTKCGPKDDPGANAADAGAVNLAKSARFQPLRWSGFGQPVVAPNHLTWGRLVFHWRTTAAPVTNTVPNNP